MKRAVVGCLVALGMWMPRDAAAQIPGWNQRSFIAERIDAERIRLMREVEIEGEPGTANAGQKFFADDLQMNIRTGELSAIGNVVFSTPIARISADSVVFNTKTKRGTFTNAHGIAQLGERGERNRSMFGTLEPDVYFHGATIEKISDDKYRLTRGAFTTCVQPTPRWEIISGTATLNLDDYVVMRNAVVRVKDVPIFYLPVLYYPIQEDDRATGFLLPMYGTSLATGSSIGNAFFWAINRSQDATFFHDWMFTRGQGMGAEYRYLLGPQAQGDFKYYWLDEKDALINGQQRTARQSKSMRGGLRQSLPFGLSARAQIDYVTDISVRQTYDRNFYNAANSVRAYQGGLAGAFRTLSGSASFNRMETFSDATRSTVTGRAPGFAGALSGLKLGPLPVFATVNAESGHSLLVYKVAGAPDNDLSLNITDYAPSIRAPLSTLPFLQLNLTAAYRRTTFSESLAADLRTQVEEPIIRSYTDLRVEVIGPVVTRVFNPNNGFADRLKHVIEPTFSISNRSEIPTQNRIPGATGSDIIVGAITQMNYGLTNRLLARKAKPEDAALPTAGAPREVLNLTIRQSHYTDGKANTFDQSYTYGFNQRAASTFSPVAVTARAMPTEALGIDYRLEYDPVALPLKPRLLGMGLNGVLKSTVADVSAGWNRSAFSTGTIISSNEYIQGQADLRLWESRIGGSVSLNYDTDRRMMLNQRYMVFYNAQCCGVNFEYQTFNYPDIGQFILPQDRRFNMSFTLAGVGSFSNFFGAFGGNSGIR